MEELNPMPQKDLPARINFRMEDAAALASEGMGANYRGEQRRCTREGFFSLPSNGNLCTREGSALSCPLDGPIWFCRTKVMRCVSATYP